MAATDAAAPLVQEGEALIAELMDYGGPHPDPYPIYRRLREIDPMFRSERLGLRVVTGHQEVLELHTNRSLGLARNADVARADPRFRHSSYFQFLPRMTPWIDPPQHTRLRQLFAPAFTPRRINALEGYVQDYVDRLLDEAEQRETPDLIGDFAVRLPVATISHLLGLPEEVHEAGLRWAQSMAEAILSVEGIDDELLAVVDASVSEGAAYLAEQIAERRVRPREDLLSALIAADNKGDRLSEQETVSLAFQLFIAAAETTVGSTGLGLRALLDNPDQLALLRRSPELDARAVEEILRYDAPTQMNLRRYVLEDTEINGLAVAAGEVLLPVNAAANRDPAQSPDPDVFDVTRSGSQIMSFGRGIHSCVGAPLARLQIRIAVGTVIRRYPKLAYAAPPTLRGSAGLRGLAAFPVRLDPA
jgi:cytochrome P450